MAGVHAWETPGVAAVPARGLALLLGVALAANLAALLPLAVDLRAAALWLILVALPGLLAAGWLLRWPTTWMDRWHFGLFSIGLGYALLILVMWGLALLPGGLAGWQVLAACGGLSALLAVPLRLGWRTPPPEPLPETAPDAPGARAWQIAAFVSVLLVATLLRLPSLGYADFHGDEARAMLRAADVIQGYESALLIHKKGPAEILLPAAFYAPLGTITEGVARLPFALANLTAVLALLLLGWRMAGPVAGWAAAMLLAVDGYLNGFARFVQYQSVVLLMTVLVVLALYTQLRRGRATASDLWLAALCFTAGMLAHYEAVWAVLPGVYLLAVLVRRGEPAGKLARRMVWPALATVVILALFYIPFMRDVRFARTADDILGNRIGGRFPYNNLWDFFQRTTIYSASYYVLALMAGAVAGLAVIFRRNWPGWAAWTATGLVVAGIAASFVEPGWLVIDGTDQTWLFYAIVVAAVLRLPHVTAEEHTLWLWFGVPLVISIFFVSKPNTHVYGFFPAWALIGGLAANHGWHSLRSRLGLRPARWIALPLAGALLLIFGNYIFWYFGYSGAELMRTWTANRIPGYWVPYSVPNRHSLFGFPYNPGWKVVGALYANGTLDAPFDSNETSRVAEWYARDLLFCPPDREYYMLAASVQPNRQEEYDGLLFELAQNGLREFGRVEVGGDPRLRIFTMRPVDGPIRIYDEATHAAFFDANLAGPNFLKNGPLPDGVPLTAVDPQAVPVAYTVGGLFHLVGYSLTPTQVAPDDQVRVRLYWRIDDAIDRDYKMSVQLIDTQTLHKAAQRDSEPGCTVYAADEWRAGEINLDPYTLRIAPDTPPGRYALQVGIYGADDQVRLPVTDAGGAVLGDVILLSPVEVVAP